MPEYDGRYEVEIVYGVVIGGVTLIHRHSFDVHMDGDQPTGEPFDSYGLLERGGGDVQLGLFIQDYIDVWSPLLGSTTSLEEIILWRYDDEPSTAKIFCASATTLPTTSFTGTAQAAHGVIFTFRVLSYRYPMRMYIMEGGNSGELRVPAASLTGTNAAYKNYVISPASPIWGRSNAAPIAAIAMNSGQNEKLRNLRYR